MQIFIHRDNQQLGPFTETEIKAQLASGALSLQDHAWWQGQTGWMPLGQTSLASTLAPSSLPPVPVPGTPAIPPTPAASGAPSSKLALWSLICGILGFFCSLLTAIPAIILGHMSLAEIKKNPGLKGQGLALAGLILGYIVMILFVISLVAIITLRSLGAQTQETFKQIEQQVEAAQSTNSADQSTNSDQPANLTNSPDETTNSSDSSMTNSPDQSTSSTDTNSSDTSTNSAPSTNSN